MNSRGQLATFVGGSAVATLYLDGEVVASSTRTLETNTDSFYISEHKVLSDANSLNWIGKMDDAVLYNFKLSASEVARFVESSLPMIASFNHWINGQTDIPVGQRGALDDYVGDRTGHLLDYALGLDPSQPATDFLPKLHADNHLFLE